MLNTQKSINLTGQSRIAVDGQEVIVVSLSANVYTDGNNANVVSTIVNKEVYAANKKACRSDIDAFTAEVREMEDSITTESGVTE